MNTVKTYGLAMLAIAFSACGPASEQAQGGAETAQLESMVTAPIKKTTCLVEATEPGTYGPDVNGVRKISAQASIWDCSQDYPIVYTCSILEKQESNGTWTAVPNTRSCWGEVNSDFAGQTSNPIVHAAGTYRQRAQGAIKLNATTWSPAQPSTCATLSSNVPCTFKEVISDAITL